VTSRRVVRLLLTAAVLGLCLGGCRVEREDPPDTLRVGLFSVVDSLPYFVIRDQGFGRRQGLQFVEEGGFPGGAAVLDAMVAGRVDLAPVVGTAPYLAAAEAGHAPGGIVAIAANSVADGAAPGIGILAHRSIAGWRDLDGGIIAVNALRSIATPAVQGRLKTEGVGRVRLVEVAPPNMGLAVRGGEVSAAAMLEPFISQSLLRGDGHLLGWVVGGPPFERMQMSTVAARTALHRERPRALARYLRAHLEAARWIAENPEAAKLLVARTYGLTPEIGRRVTLLRWPADGRHDFQSLEQAQRLYVEMGLLRRPLDLRAVMDETTLGQARSGP
jgi:NitT/TauT family transport system substrate-binding protein